MEKRPKRARLKKRRSKPKRSEQPGKRGQGRPTKFNDVLHAKIIALAKAGHTDFDIATAVGVCERTINYWKHTQDGFLQSLQGAKDIADSLVEAAMFQRAVGFRHEAVKFFPEYDKGRLVDVHEKTYTEIYPPDTVAGMFWLKNRQPERWKDKPEAPPPDDAKKTEIVYETEWGGTGEAPSPQLKSDGEGES